MSRGWTLRGTGDGTNGTGDGTNNGGDSNSGPTGGGYGGGVSGDSTATPSTPPTDDRPTAPTDDPYGMPKADYSLAPNTSISAPGLKTADNPSFGPGYSVAPSNTPSGLGLTPSDSATTLGLSVPGVVDTSPLVSQVNPYSLSAPVTYSAVQTMKDMGWENAVGTNVNNPTQTVSQVLASKTVHDALNQSVPGIALGFVSGISPALSAALRLGMATQNNTFGQTVGGLLGSLTGSPAIGSIGALMGRSVDTGMAPTAKDVASVGWSEATRALGQQAANLGYGVAGPLGASIASRAASDLSKSAFGSISAGMSPSTQNANTGFGRSAPSSSGTQTSTPFGGKR